MADVVMNALGIAVEEHRGKSIMSGLHGMWSTGTLAGAAIGVPAAHAGLDGRVHLAAMAAVLLVAALVITAGAPDVRPAEDEEAPPRFALPPRAALVIGAIGFCGVFAEGGSADWCAVYLRDIAHASPGGRRARVHRVLLHDGGGPAAGRPGGTAAGRGDHAAGRRGARRPSAGCWWWSPAPRPRPSRVSR